MKVKMGKKYYLIFIVGFIIILVILWISFFKTNDSIKVGLILSLSGVGKNSGQDILKGILLAVDETNRWGGINNKKVKLIIRDCESNPDKAVKIFNEIEKREKPLLYISNLSSVSIKLSEEAEKNKVVLCALASTDLKIVEDNTYTYRYWLPLETEVESLFEIFYKLNVENIALLYCNEQFAKSLKDSIIKKNSKYKITSQFYESIEKDLDEIIKQIIDKEAVCLITYDSQMAPIINCLKENNYKGNIIGMNSIMSSFLRKDFRIERFYASSPLIYNGNYQFANRVKINYEKKFNNKFNHFSGNGYDMIQIIFDILKDKNIDRVSLEKYLNIGFVHTGVFGTLVVKKGMHDFYINLYPVKVENGKIIFDW